MDCPRCAGRMVWDRRDRPGAYECINCGAVEWTQPPISMAQAQHEARFRNVARHIGSKADA